MSHADFPSAEHHQTVCQYQWRNQDLGDIKVELVDSPRPPTWILGVLLLREGGEGKGRGSEGGRGGRGEGEEKENGEKGRGRGRKGKGKEGGKPPPQLSCHTPGWGILEICLVCVHAVCTVQGLLHSLRSVEFQQRVDDAVR